MLFRSGITAVIAVLGGGFGLYYADFSPLWSYLIAVNAVTFLFYGFDKAIAGRGVLRVPEVVLHLLALVGGSPAALVGQKLFRHKTAKDSFQSAYWAVVILQSAIIVAFLYLRYG